MIRFLIDDAHEDGRRYEVRVYPNRRAYLAACRRRRPSEQHRSSHATCFHEQVIHLGRDGEREDPVVGVIYAHQEMLDGEIVSHECTHAALDLYRHRQRGAANLGRNKTDLEVKREEKFALSVGRLSQQIADALWERKVWTRKVA